jgi:hypothetical protein
MREVLRPRGAAGLECNEESRAKGSGSHNLRESDAGNVKNGHATLKYFLERAQRSFSGSIPVLRSSYDIGGVFPAFTKAKSSKIVRPPVLSLSTNSVTNGS